VSTSHQETHLIMDLQTFQSAKLRENSHKTHWDECTYLYLINSLMQEVQELRDAFLNRESPDEISRECADIANFAAMISQNVQDETK